MLAQAERRQPADTHISPQKSYTSASKPVKATQEQTPITRTTTHGSHTQTPIAAWSRQTLHHVRGLPRCKRGPSRQHPPSPCPTPCVPPHHAFKASTRTHVSGVASNPPVYGRSPSIGCRSAADRRPCVPGWQSRGTASWRLCRHRWPSARHSHDNGIRADAPVHLERQRDDMAHSCATVAVHVPLVSLVCVPIESARFNALPPPPPSPPPPSSHPCAGLGQVAVHVAEAAPDALGGRASPDTYGVLPAFRAPLPLSLPEASKMRVSHVCPGFRRPMLLWVRYGAQCFGVTTF